MNHTIVHARDNRESAEFLARILGLEVGDAWGPFIPVATANGVTLDFTSIPAGSITVQHYAFLISAAEFDAAFARVQEAGITYYADPRLKAARGLFGRSRRGYSWCAAREALRRIWSATLERDLC